MDLGLENKIFMVAASSRGLGFGIADALAREGAQISLASRNAEAIEAAAGKLREQYGVIARGYVFDATDPELIKKWGASTLQDFGSVDGLVVNAGGPPAGTFDRFNDAAWQQAFELTLLSAVRMIRVVLPVFRQKKSGSILTVTSTSIKEPIDQLLLSNVLRSGVASLVKSLSRDLAAEGIRINNLVPGRIDTARVRVLDQIAAKNGGISVEQHREAQELAIPAGRYGTIEEFGAAAAFLLSEAASYITGSTLVVDGGKTRAMG